MLYTVNVCKTSSEFQTITNQSWKESEDKKRSLPAVQTELVAQVENELPRLMLLSSSAARDDVV